MAELTVAAPIKKKKATSPRRVSLAAYFRAEEKALERHEYHDGIIKPMPRETYNHSHLGSRTVTYLTNFVEENDLNYDVHGSDLKVRIDSENRVVYPDAIVVCDEPIYFEDRDDTITNPRIIVEVLSNSTRKNDLGSKFGSYRTIPTFQEYVMIEQERQLVVVYTRQADDTWILREYKGEDAIAILYTLHECPLLLKRLYRGLVLKPI